MNNEQDFRHTPFQGVLLLELLLFQGVLLPVFTS